MPDKNILSLSRFFHQKESFPCLVAGRFFNKSKNSFILKSQGHFILCKKNKNFLKELKEGSWICVELKSKKLLEKTSQQIFVKKEACANQKILKVNTKEDCANSNIYETGLSYLLKVPRTDYKVKSFAYEKKGQVLQDWFHFLRLVEDFFIKQGLAYAETPNLVLCPGTEPHLYPIKSSLDKYYLATSPEMSLKKLLCQDWTDFFEIKTCYRKEISNEIHQVEFSLLEWYRAFYSAKDLMKELSKLLVFLNRQAFCKNLFKKTYVWSMKELFQKHLDFNLTPESSKKDLLQLARRENVLVPVKSNFEDVFLLLFLNKIEAKLPYKNPVFIYDYPPQMRAFAQINSRGWADRFELYWQKMELANAFYEVTDAKEQKMLFKNHLKERTDEVPLDKELLESMDQAMPEVSGVALGLDRLFLALTGKKSLREIRLFPL